MKLAFRIVLLLGVILLTGYASHARSLEHVNRLSFQNISHHQLISGIASLRQRRSPADQPTPSNKESDRIVAEETNEGDDKLNGINRQTDFRYLSSDIYFRLFALQSLFRPAQYLSAHADHSLFSSDIHIAACVFRI